MSLKAGWLALFIFVWIIGAFLGSTFEYQSSETGGGIAYSTGTATFTNGSDVVTSGGGAAWTSAMENANIKLDADDLWTKVRFVGGGYLTNGHGMAANVPITLTAGGATVVTVTRLGTLYIDLPAGSTGTAVSGVCTVVGSPDALVAGRNTISTTGVVGTITINVVGNVVVFLYNPYTGTGGAGAYTMAVSPGWVGVGSGGYAESPVTTIEYIFNIKNAITRLNILGVVPMPVPNEEYFNAIYKALTWRWSFLDGYEMFYWIFCAPFVVMGILCLILLVYGIVTGNLSLG